MAHLIDKDAVLAEIDKRIKVLQKHPMENHKTICHLDSVKQSVNSLEVKEVDSKLTLEDIEIILGIENNILHECNDNCQLVIEAYPKGQDYYGEILRRFNNQRIKPQRMISAEAKEAMYNKPANEYESLTDFGKQMKK